MKMGATTWSAGEPSAELLTWDSEFWNVRIGRATSLMDDWALENTVGCLWLLIPAFEQGEVHRAEAGGARVMDVRVKLERDTGPEIETAIPLHPSELEECVAIARTAFRGLTRFYADPRFPDERCDDLYENWVRDSAAGWAKEILVDGGDIDGPGGFITIHVDGDEASIGLIAVAERWRGSSLGVKLTLSAVNWAFRHDIPKITVVTQGCNIPAQRTFQRAEFVTASTDIFLHKWMYE